jgi:PAS domain S-box-containing protein
MALMSGNLLFLSRIAPTVFDDGHKGVTVILEDITERKHAEDALRESEERYRTLVEIFPDAIILHCGGRIVYLNPAALSLFGATCSDEIIGKNILDFIHPAFRDTVLKNIKKDLRGESTPLIELQIIRTDGTPVTVEGRGVGTSINGKPAIQVAIRDITERRHAEEALYENEERFRKIFENSPVGMALVLPDFRFRMVNPRLCRMLGYPRNKLLTMSFTDITHPDDVVKDVEQVKKFGTGDLEIYKTEKRYLKSDGSVITASVTVSPVKDNRNRMMYAVALIEESPGSGRAVKKRRKIKKR